MPIANKIQMVFAGVNPSAPNQLVRDDELATATNIDFSIERGAATVRRGSIRKYVCGTSTSPVYRLEKHYTTSLASSLMFARCGAAVYRGSSGTLSLVASGLTGSEINTADMGFSQYRDKAFLGLTPYGSSLSIDENGTSRSWVLEAPPAVVVGVAGTLADLNFVAGWTVPEGTDGGLVSGTQTVTADVDTLRINAQASINWSGNLASNGGVIGDYGIDYVTLKISDPVKVTHIYKDFSIGDATFENYYHAEMDVVLGEDVLADPVVLTDALIENTEGEAIDAETREEIISILREGLRIPVTRVSAAKDSWTTWGVQRPNFKFIGNRSGGGDWSNIGAARIVVVARDTVVVEIKNWVVKGAEGYPLNDANVGYAYWETFATYDGTVKVEESAPGPVSARVKIQQGKMTVVSSNTSPTDATHRILYAQGGFLRQPYAVATNTVATLTYTHNTSDVQVITDGYLMDPTIRSAFYNTVKAASEPLNDRIFVGWGNKIAWSKPGKPGSFPRESFTRVSHEGDNVQKLLVWSPGLVVINRDSVYELHGSIFEGASQDWVLQRTGARRGSRAVNVPIKTPYGIPLIDYDGLYMYIPGQGVDQEISWAAEVIADAWRGVGASDPAAQKGSRVPAINLGVVYNASCAYTDGKLYLAVPTGSDTIPKTVFVFDFRFRKVWWYTYNFAIYSLFWDAVNNVLLAGSSAGAIMQIETGDNDQTTSGVAQNISYYARTKQWTTPADTLAENLQLEHRGPNIIAKAVVDSTATQTLGTLTSTNRDWSHPTLSGTIGNNVQFEFSGSHTDGAPYTTLWGLDFDALVEPKRIDYFHTDYFDNNYPAEKLWDVDVSDVEIFGTGTVSKVTYVDGTAVMTSALVGPTPKRKTFNNSFPANTYGNIGYSIYTADAATDFKLWRSTFMVRNEPPRVNTWKTEVKSLEENIVDAVDVDIAPNGTVLGTIFVDNVAISTATFTGNNQQSFTHKLPIEQYGRTVYALYSGSSFKHYKTWWHLRPQPDRWTNYVTDKYPLPSDSQPRTLLATLDCLGGSVTGTLILDWTAVSTHTFTGSANRVQTHRRALDLDGSYAIQTASDMHMIYNAVGSGKFKHYNTQFETERKPFGKKQWSITYKKLGGATEIDMARFWSLDAETNGTATITSVWDVDAGATNTETHTITNRQYKPRMSFPPGVRSRLFQIRMWSSQNFQVYKTNLDIMRVAPKGVSRISLVGQPAEQFTIGPTGRAR